MQTKNSPAENTADREIRISREFDAPRELVWQAMTDPKHIVNWWGPRGFSTTVEEMDVRPDGVWKHVMRGPDGVNYPNKSLFKEVVKPERIVFSHGGHREDGPGVRFLATWSFDQLAPKRTRVTIHMVFKDQAERDFVVKEFGAVEGGKQTLERLGEQLAAMAASGEGDRDFVLTRTFDAPRELVWRAWTEPAHMAQWWGPRDFTNPVCELDVRAGGAYRLVMRAPDGSEYPAKGVFQEVVKPERLVMQMDVSDHPDEWYDIVDPGRDKTKKPSIDCVQTVTFEALGERTRLTIRTRFASTAIRDGMLRAGMAEGWPQSLDRLEKLLGKMA